MSTEPATPPATPAPTPSLPVLPGTVGAIVSFVAALSAIVAAILTSSPPEKLTLVVATAGVIVTTFGQLHKTKRAHLEVSRAEAVAVAELARKEAALIASQGSTSNIPSPPPAA